MSSKDYDARKEFARELADGIRTDWQPTPSESIYEWGEREIVFAKPYPAMEPGRYEVDRNPCMREPMDAIADRDVREVFMLKSPQCGGSENLLLMPMRHAVCCEPKTVVYIGGEQKSTEEFIEERIKPGLQLSKELRRRYRTARVREHTIYYPDMIIVMGWARSAHIFKQRPVDLGLADEFDMWDQYNAEKLRGRFLTRPFSKLVGISSLDAKAKVPTEMAPIWCEIMLTDQRRYFIMEPESAGKRHKRWFKFDMGWKDRRTGKQSPFGLKWSEDARLPSGEWDIDVVRESAYYLTPWGSRIDEDLRNELLPGGKWIPQAECHDTSKRGYIHPAMDLGYVPFGDIAKQFLNAKELGQKALKVFIYERLCEAWRGKKTSFADDAIQERQGEYARGTCFSKADGVCNEAGDTFAVFYIKKETAIYVTVDVQRKHGYWIAREWIKGGDSGLIDFGEWVSWSQIRKIVSGKHGVGANRCLVDSNFADRRQEVYEACYKYRYIPTEGKENIPELLFKSVEINPFLGTRKASKSKRGVIELIMFRTDPFKSQMVDRIKGDSDKAWFVFNGIPIEYVDQVNSEEKIDGDWKKKQGHPENHWWDCEVLQLLAATRFDFNRFKGFDVVAD